MTYRPLSSTATLACLLTLALCTPGCSDDAGTPNPDGDACEAP